MDGQVTSFLFMKYKVKVLKWDRRFAHPFFNSYFLMGLYWDKICAQNLIMCCCS